MDVYILFKALRTKKIERFCNTDNFCMLPRPELTRSHGFNNLDGAYSLVTQV